MSMEPKIRIGFRLKVARERSRLTQQQLADAVGLRHRQTVASIESGERRLSASELIRVMQVLRVDLDYFTDPFRLAGEGHFSIRTSTRVEPQVLDQFERRAGRWIAMYRELSRDQGHPPRWLGYKLHLSPDSSFGDAQAAGEAAVDLCELGARPAERLRAVMEDRFQILVLYVDTPPGISGAAFRAAGLDCALVNRQESEGRRNFGLAHDLFHLLTWDALPPERMALVDGPKRGKRWRVDQLAEYFAAALLMPTERLKQAWEATSAVGDVHQRLNGVANEMGVSSLTCQWRLRNIGLLSKQQAKVIDDGILVASRGLECRTSRLLPFSREFIRCVASALDAGRLSVKRAAHLLDMSVARLARTVRAYGHETYFEA